jgi:hypothetical protein
MADDSKVIVPDTLPKGFASVEPHINEEQYKFTVYLSNGNYYTVTNNARKPVELFERLFCAADAEKAVPRRQIASLQGATERFFYVFPEAVIQFTQDTLESIEGGWPEEAWEEEGEEEEEEDDDRPRGKRKPKKRW